MRVLLASRLEKRLASGNLVGAPQFTNPTHTVYGYHFCCVVQPGGRALIFSTTAQADFSAQQTQDWDNLLASFTPRTPVSRSEPGEQE